MSLAVTVLLFRKKIIERATNREHLYGRHEAPIQCTRCWIPLKSQDELEIHTNATPLCDSQIKVVEGITRDKIKRLKSRKKACPDQSEEERWREVYRTLSPGEPVPCPCKAQPLRTSCSQS